jgi:hypothetical protein
LPFQVVESLKALPALPVGPVQPPVVPPVAPNNGMMEYWIIGIMGIKKDKVRINGLFLF